MGNDFTRLLETNKKIDIEIETKLEDITILAESMIQLAKEIHQLRIKEQYEVKNGK